MFIILAHVVHQGVAILSRAIGQIFGGTVTFGNISVRRLLFNILQSPIL